MSASITIDKKTEKLLFKLFDELDLKIAKGLLIKSLQKTNTIIKGESIYSPPENDKDQIERISAFLQVFKRENRITGEEIIQEMPKAIRISRTALNAYIYGTVKTPPSRDFLITLFKCVGVNEAQLDMALGLCGYAGVSGKDSANKLIRQLTKKSGKELSLSSIDKLTNRIVSMAEMLIEEESKELEKSATTN